MVKPENAKAGASRRLFTGSARDWAGGESRRFKARVSGDATDGGGGYSSTVQPAMQGLDEIEGAS
jgi:hypothetical protein